MQDRQTVAFGHEVNDEKVGPSASGSWFHSPFLFLRDHPPPRNGSKKRRKLDFIASGFGALGFGLAT